MLLVALTGCDVGGLPTAQLGDLATISAAAKARPGVQAAGATINFTRQNDGNTVRTLAVNVDVDGTVLDDRSRMSELDRAIKADAKRLYRDIDNVDYLAVNFRHVQGFGPFSFTKSNRLPPTRTQDIDGS